ncbi:hypothetical protein Q9Q99_07970 [Curtobacterium flaccumfaciens]|nr:hypothetical protein Q9Q99_07970 [Curtobacterium flaccumfaciens]
MNTRTRVSLTAVAACVVVAALSGCAASTPTPAPSATTAMTGDKTPLPSPSPTATDAATTDDQTPSTPPTSPSKAPGTSALAQHIYDECSKGAADAGVTPDLHGRPVGVPGQRRDLPARLPLHLRRRAHRSVRRLQLHAHRRHGGLLVRQQRDDRQSLTCRGASVAGP